MIYSDKVQASRNNAYDTAIANKIIDMMQELKLKNDEKTACRWMWELIQNAKDAADDTRGVNIEVEFNEKEKYLVFKHDGKNFTTDNIVYLISQVSSKERHPASDSGVTGKFGSPRHSDKDWLSKDWFESVIKECKEHIKYVPIFDTISGERKTLFDFWDCQDVLIIGDSKEVTRELVWEMGKSVYPDRMVLFSEIHRWYASLWVERRNFGVKKLVRDVEGFGSLEELEKVIKDKANSIDWLNRLYGI